MWKNCSRYCNCVAAVSIAVNLVLTSRSLATTYSWTRPNGCGIFSCDFFNASYWSPAGGPPSTGDIATISMIGNTHLSQSTAVLGNLTLQTSTKMRTFGNRLNVAGSPGNLFLFGSGFQGSTRLQVNPGGGFEVTAKTISLHQGSELSILGGGVVATFRVLVSSSSLISGYGTIGLVGNEIGSSLELTGKLQPHSGDLTIISPNSFLDLDGNLVGTEPGFVDVTSTGNLILNGKHFDPFSGRFDLGNNRVVTFDSPWSVDGNLNITSANNNRLVGPMFSFLSGAQISTNNSSARIEGKSLWGSGVSLNLASAGDNLQLIGNSTIESGALFTGNGFLTNATGSTMSLSHGAIVGVDVLNNGTLAVGQSPGTSTVQDYIQGATGSLAVELGGVMASQLDTLAINGNAQIAGTLSVSLLSPFTLAMGQSFKIMDVAGTRTGSFNGLGQGDLVGSYSGTDLFISYSGGDGNDVVLYTAGIPGDFDFDGDVDGRDFLIWQRTPNVGNLTDWQNNYGMVAPLATTSNPVPEPGALWLLLTGILLSSGRKPSSIPGVMRKT